VDTARRSLGTWALLVALVVPACGFGSGSSADPTDLERPGPSSSVSRSPFTLPPSPPESPPTETPASPGGPSPTASPSRTPFRPDLSCPRRPLLGVYSPQRLHVLQPCQRFVGFLARIVQLPDYDVRFDLVPAPGYYRFLNAANLSAQHGQFVAVMIYGQPMQFFRPSIGQRVAVFGTWVRDVEHGWNEMHPVWEVRYPDSGTLIYAIPPDPPLHVPDR
jgi:hypothetical protein